MNKQKKIDLYFGFQNEDKIHKELEETFGELKNTSDNEDYGKHFEFDKYNDKCFLEIKSRRIPHNKYMSLMFGFNKYEKGNKLIEEDKDLRIFYIWKCTDGLFYWEHGSSDYEIKFSGRMDRGCDERADLVHISQENIKPLKDFSFSTE